MKSILKVSCGIIEKEKKILIAQRKNKGLEALNWEFPGGKLEIGESPEAALIRELQEELEVTVKIIEKLDSILVPRKNIILELIPFRCVIINGQIKLLEHNALEWVTLESVLNYNLCEGDAKIVRQLKLRKK